MITVVGAGLSGLTLARVLQRRGTPVVVYDLDAGPDARAQGGMLDLHVESGQAALRAAGLFDAFERLVLTGGEALRVLDREGTVRHEDEGSGERPEIAREDLRHLLLEALEPGTVRWGRKLVGARPLGDGRHELSFADGSTTTSTVLVGADGAWSRVRRLLTDATPDYLGYSFVITRLHDVDARHPAAAGVVGNGSMMALADGRGLIAHREPGTVVEVYAALRGDPVAEDDRSDLPDLLRRAFADWAPELRSLVEDADSYVARPLHGLSPGTSWPRSSGVTLLGDAAHVMSPFAGEGANLAMQDAAELGEALAGAADVEAVLAEYEAAMVPRAAAMAAESAANLELAFRADAPQGMVDFFTGGGPSGRRAP